MCWIAEEVSSPGHPSWCGCRRSTCPRAPAVASAHPSGDDVCNLSRIRNVRMVPPAVEGDNRAIANRA
eukprot:scaffold70724_cov29-Tisochrysis_lutea.AAC.3